MPENQDAPLFYCAVFDAVPDIQREKQHNYAGSNRSDIHRYCSPD
jgi:hypothetical protein